MEENRYIAALAYVWILFLIPMLAKPQSAFARAHTNQGILLFLASIAVGLITFLLSFVPIINILGWIVSVLFSLAYTVAAIYQIVLCVQGRFKPVPLVGNIKVLNR